jgi:N-acyl-D-aspartate/D-glutamate deacylase
VVRVECYYVKKIAQRHGPHGDTETGAHQGNNLTHNENSFMHASQEGRELAVHKMTGTTARALKLRDRGLLEENYCADVVIFDPADFRDRATYADPHQYPTGTRTTVIVNGTVVVENATHTGALPGVVLRRDGDGQVG